MLPGIGVALVCDLAAIDAILQHEIEGTAGELVTAIDGPVPEGAAFTANFCCVEFSFKGTHRSEFDVAPVDIEDGLCLLLVDDELPVSNIVAERRQATH